VLIVKAYDTKLNKIRDIDKEISKHKKTKIREMEQYWKIQEATNMCLKKKKA